MDGEVRELFYQKPYHQSFSTPSCRDPGAQWTVTVGLRADGREQIIDALCKGSDPNIRAAWSVVSGFMNDIAAGLYRSAYARLESELKAQLPFDAFISQMRTVRLDRDQRVNGGCLDVEDSGGTPGTPIRIKTTYDCRLVDASGKSSSIFPLTRFTVVRRASRYVIESYVPVE
jgi:hypothetical protein